MKFNLHIGTDVLHKVALVVLVLLLAVHGPHALRLDNAVNCEGGHVEREGGFYP